MQIILYDDYAEELPEYVEISVIRQSTNTGQASHNKHTDYYYILANHVQMHDQFVEANALRKQADGEEDIICIFIPQSGIKCIIQSE